MALVGRTDATRDQLGLGQREDDEKLQLGDNIVPVVNAESAGDAKVAAALDPLAAKLTTEDLAELNAKVDAERQKAADVAKEYLTSAGLL